MTLQELTGPNREYESYAAADLRTLAGALATIKTDLRQGNLSAARTDWLTAQLDWEKAGASYDSFGADGTAVDGLPDGLVNGVNGVNDQDFTGLHRLEYGLWHGQSAATLLPVVNVLAKDVATVQQNLTSSDWPATRRTCRSRRTKSWKTRCVTTSPGLTTRAAVTPTRRPVPTFR